MGGDHAASGFEIADLDAKTQHSAQIVGRLQQKGMDGTGFRQTDIVVGKRGVEVDGFPFCQKVVRSEEHTSELQSLMRIAYAVFCLKKKKKQLTHDNKRQA